MTKTFFAKLPDGTWGVRVFTDAAPDIGAELSVSKRSGGSSVVVVTDIVQPFDGGWLCRFVDADNGPERPAPAATAPRGYVNTAEQDHALAIFRTGASLAIEAGAGTGKTVTLIMLSEDAHGRGKRGQYIAFNKPIVVDVGGKLPPSVGCDTAHALAYRAMAAGTPFVTRMKSGARMKSQDIARVLRLDPVTVTKHDGESKTLSPAFLAGVVMKGANRFCQTADPEPTYRHLPLIDNLDAPPSPDRPMSYAVNDTVRRALEPALKRAWRDLSMYRGELPFTLSTAMAVYLKLWQLSAPRINVDYILFDEAQDASPVMVDVIRQQTHAQLVWVGDSNQQIYSFTGAINALANVPADDRAMLTQSFRFGPAVADIANSVLAELPTTMRLVGTESIPSRVVPIAEPAAVLTRTNATALRAVITALADGQKAYLVGGGKDIATFVRAAQDLQDGRRTDHPELGCFDNWGEVQEYVEHDEQGDDLRLMVKLIDDFGCDAILDAINGCAKEADADVVVSTAHKAKGRQWTSVQIGSDFPEAAKMNDDERRLLYVAVTRAKLELDITAVPYFADPDGDPTGVPAGEEVA